MHEILQRSRLLPEDAGMITRHGVVTSLAVHATTVHEAQAAPATARRVTCLPQCGHRLAKVLTINWFNVGVTLVKESQLM